MAGRGDRIDAGGTFADVEVALLATSRREGGAIGVNNSDLRREPNASPQPELLLASLLLPTSPG